MLALVTSLLLAGQTAGAEGESRPPTASTVPGVAAPAPAKRGEGSRKAGSDSQVVGQGPRRGLYFRIALGEEWDSNALRAITGDAVELGKARLPSGPAIGDAVTRLLVDTEGELALARGHTLRVGYLLGAKRFLTQETEDLLVHDLSAASTNALTDRLSLSPWGTFRASRIRSGTRDYSLGAAGIAADYRLEALVFQLGGSIAGFEFEPDQRFSYFGPSAGGEVRFLPTARLSFALRIDHSWRRFPGNAPVIGTVPMTASGEAPMMVATFCDRVDDQLQPGVDCTPVARRDRELALALRTAYRGSVIAGGEYLFRAQRSNSDLEDIDRHRLTAFLTVPLPFEVTGNLLAALQINNGVSVTQKFVGEDDENQNSVQAQLSRRLIDPLGVELRYALFANQFSTAPARFFRQTIYLGLTYRTAARP